jgi:hypothetical protein
MHPLRHLLPQSWGHRGDWRLAVTAGGSGHNALTPNAAELMDQPSGNAVFNDIPVRVLPLREGERAEAA